MSFMLYLDEVKDMDIEKNKERFISLFETYIKRRNSEHLLNYIINKSDFFTAPASTRYHGAYEGGLCEHSLQVYDCLKDYLSRVMCIKLIRKTRRSMARGNRSLIMCLKTPSLMVMGKRVSL